eukprot:TRINITY_DN152_c0_g1_i1.p1 TRINITY_DN152_c0_g1~~TRINITY_DN152_c0_g1_i1.p1  ORF type:complete len:234 (-),score=85.77 TRINITY_DN152_c0_g1_i1:112-813(-)
MKVLYSIALIFIFCFFINDVAGQCNARYSGTHTMCKYPTTQTNAIRTGIGATTKQNILNIFNQLRNKTAAGRTPGQPNASNMRVFVWQTELASIAQRWANQISFGHDSNRTTPAFSWVGQNVAMQGSTAETSFNWGWAINAWQNEYTLFNPNNISPFVFSSATGHYTQNVWADTYTVGCGYAYYKSGSFFQHYYVCNYGPGGNYQGATMYKVGKCATVCSGRGINTQYKCLCN